MREDVHVQAEAGRGAEKVRDVREVSANGDSQADQKVLLRPMLRQMVGGASGADGIERGAQLQMWKLWKSFLFTEDKKILFSRLLLCITQIEKDGQDCNPPLSSRHKQLSKTKCIFNFH